MPKALFLYSACPSSSRADALHYVGILAPDQDPMELIRPYLLTERPGVYPEDLESDLRDRDGGIYYAVLDLDQPGLFLDSFEHEDGDWKRSPGSIMKSQVRITDELFGERPVIVSTSY